MNKQFVSFSSKEEWRAKESLVYMCPLVLFLCMDLKLIHARMAHQNIFLEQHRDTSVQVNQLPAQLLI